MLIPLQVMADEGAPAPDPSGILAPAPASSSPPKPKTVAVSLPADQLRIVSRVPVALKDGYQTNYTFQIMGPDNKKPDTAVTEIDEKYTAVPIKYKVLGLFKTVYTTDLPDAYKWTPAGSNSGSSPVGYLNPKDETFLDLHYCTTADAKVRKYKPNEIKCDCIQSFKITRDSPPQRDLTTTYHWLYRVSGFSIQP
jgi:hypothetical protein